MRGRGRKRWRRRIAEGELVADVDDGTLIHQCSRGFPFCGLVEVSWCQAGVLLGSFWGLLEPCLGTPLTFSFGSLGGPPGAILDRVGHGWAPDSPLHEFKDRLFGALLGCSWVAPGRFGGRLGAFLGPSSGIRGPSWNHLEASKVHCKRKRENAYNGEAQHVLGGSSIVGGLLPLLRCDLKQAAPEQDWGAGLGACIFVPARGSEL